MAFSLKGYVLEKPRLGTSNSAFTASPDNTIFDGGAFGAAYPWGSEPNPRTEYLVYVEADGNLPYARFAWTKNEGKEKLAFQRFDYEGMEQRFKLLPGGPLDQLPTPLDANANTTRLKAPKPSIDDLSLFPMRIAVGSTGSGTTMTVQLVDLDASFGSPPPGTVELSFETGNLNWNTVDLSTYAGQVVRVQRQTFFTFKDSKGRIGTVGSTLILNPLPATGQFPLIRFGYGRDLTSIERPNEGALSANPAPGTVEWALDTGLLKFNSSDEAANAGKSVYYGGVAFARDVGLVTQTLGTMPGGYVGLNMSDMPSVGGDLVIRAGSYQFPGYVYVDAFSDPIGKRGIVQIKQTGSNAEFRFSLTDTLLLAGQSVTVMIADLVVERGVALRLFRNPVNLDAANSELKDVSSVYTVTNALLASPIIGAPQVFLPSVPIDDGVAPLAVKVEQGSGSFVGPLTRLDVGSPPPGFGYVLDLDQRTLSYARRKQNHIIPIMQPSGAIYLGDPLVQPSAYTFELETGVGTNVFTTLVPDQQVLLDATSGVINFVETDGELVLEGVGASIAGTVLTDVAANFTGVQPGDILIVPGGSAKGVYVITDVPSPTSLTLDASGGTVSAVSYTVRRGREILLDRFFEEVILADPETKVERVRKLGAITNSPRFAVPLDQVDRSRFRFGLSTFSESVTVVPNDGAFTAPASLLSLAVEISADTGNVNFSQNDVNAGGDVFHVYKLKQQVDYQISAPLGFIDFNQRSLAFDEAYVTYKPEATGVLTTEQVTWQVRKEVTLDHPDPTNILSFNPTNRRVAALPPAAVFRGGRPQVTGEQCLINAGPPSTVQFLPDDILTDALPHGAIIGPGERVYVDYFIYEAMPGDKTTTVLSPPMIMVQLVISAEDDGQPNSKFTLNGDWTPVFKPNHLFRIEQEEVYIIGTVVYDTPSQTTTVTLTTPQVFANDFQAPKVFQSSGPTPFVSSPGQPSYFAPEPAAYDPVPKGSNKFSIEGDRTSVYKSGTVAAFTDGSMSFLELYLVTGAAFKAETNRTEVTLATNSLRQYVSANGHLLRHSVRPIVDSASAAVRTQRPPVTTRPATSPITVYRKIAGQKGTVLTTPTDYTIDDSGEVKFKAPLLRDEEFGILYTGNIIVNQGRNVRATYSHLIVPTAENGILNQVLRMDYQLYSPDTWFYRVETFTNYRAELSQQYEQAAKSGTPSGGPNTSNMSQPKLYEQGRPSAFFDEGRYANEDVVARASLKWYNDTINYLEDVLQNVDGRVVGHRSGRFKFDGNLNPGNVDPVNATNQIDDIVKISDAPFAISFTFPNFSVGALGTYQKFYLPSSFSRFYPTQKFIYGVSANATETGQTVLDLKAKNVTSVVDLSTRPAFAIITRDAPAGSTTITVDNAQGNAEQVRPPFLNGMKCIIQKRDGTFVSNILAPVTVTSVVSATTLAVSALPAAVPAGSTIYRSPIDDSNASGGAQPTVNQMVHYNPPSYAIDPEKGLILYMKAIPPLDGSFSPTPVPNELVIKQIPAGQPLQCFAQFSNSLTEPLRIPALDGLAIDDAGSLTFPILTPSFEAEVIPSTVLPPSGGGYAYNEYEIIKTGGSLRAATQAPFVGTGTMNAGGTIITSSTAFGSPTPQQYDLLRITSGVNATSAYRRIVSVIGTVITVDTPFTFDGSSFQFTVTVSNSLVTGNAITTTVNGALLTDTSANFVTAGVQAGHTVVFTSGSIVGGRYQVLTVTSATTLLLHTTTGLPSTPFIGYRIDNPLNTYGGPGSLFDILTTSVQGQIDVLSTNVPPKPLNEADALEATLEQAFENIVTPSTGNASGTTLTNLGATFQSSDVRSSHFLYIRNGVAAGVYKITSVDSETQITVDPPFPSADPAAGYRVVSSFGVTYNSLSDLFVQLTAIESYVAGIPGFLAKLAQAQVIKPGPVTDTIAFANTLTIADLNTREPLVQSRVNAVTDPNGIVTKVSNVLSGADKLYDKRYVWIDARINFEKGILTRLGQAVNQRKKTQADVVKNLTKLLAVS